MKIDIAALAAQQARQALQEDIGDGDLSAPLLPQQTLSARLLCRQPAVLCGRQWFEECFRQLDDNAGFDWRFEEGDQLLGGPGDDNVVCELSAAATALLAAERSAINFLQMLSATATAARRWQQAAGDRVKIVDTRKTIPLLRHAQKYAVRIGGAHNHRQGLYDEILIKENHIRAGGGIEATLAKAAQLCADNAAPPPQIEVRAIEELQRALAAGATRVLLDNFSLVQLQAAVAVAAKAPKAVELEASGNITLDDVAAIARLGVARISSGALTKNINAVDFSLLLNDNDNDNE